VDFQYLVVSANIKDSSRVDIITIDNFRTVKDRLKKEAKSGLGIEITIDSVRNRSSPEIASWLQQAKELIKFCKMSRCQFILSSGAELPDRQVSGQSLDAVLRIIGIEPQSYWQELGRWLDSRLALRVTRC